MAQKENNQRHESTIDKYFARTAHGYKAWAEEDEEGRNFLQIAARQLEIRTKKETKVTTSILLTPARSVSSQAELL